MSLIKETEFGGRKLVLETGYLAKQASGSCLVRYGETVLLVAATSSKGEEEDDFEIGLVENLAEKFSIESQNFNEIKKNGLDRAKISKGIQSVLSGKTAYNKLKAFEKGVLLALMLAECSTIGGKIAPEESSQLKKILSEQLNISSNQATVILEKKLSESLLKKVEQVEVYREKYELVEFLWERVLSTEAEVDEGGMELIRKMIRRLDISDIESEGARKEAEENLRESSEWLDS